MKKNVVYLLFLLSACSSAREPEITPITFNSSSSELLSKTQIQIEDIGKDSQHIYSGYFDLLKGEVKKYNKKIQKSPYKLKIKLENSLTPDLANNCFISLMDKDEKGEPKHPIFGLLSLVTFLPVYVVTAPVYQLIGLPWWSTSTVSMDATLSYNGKTVGTYHTDGISDSRLMQIYYGKTVGAADQSALSASFAQGVDEILTQIYNNCAQVNKAGAKIEAKEKQEKEEKLRKEKEEKERIEAQRNAFKEKYGKYRCRGLSLRGVLLYETFGDTLDRDCIHYIDTRDFFTVFQQTKDGTIISTVGHNGDNMLVMIEKNPKDSLLVDGARISSGLVNPVGTFTYTTVLGSIKTIYKFRRLSDD